MQHNMQSAVKTGLKKFFFIEIFIKKKLETITGTCSIKAAS
jgi:hypothetical protein